jgi:hypothetical protein
MKIPACNYRYRRKIPLPVTAEMAGKSQPVTTDTAGKSQAGKNRYSWKILRPVTKEMVEKSHNSCHRDI